MRSKLKEKLYQSRRFNEVRLYFQEVEDRANLLYGPGFYFISRLMHRRFHNRCRERFENKPHQVTDLMQSMSSRMKHLRTEVFSEARLTSQLECHRGADSKDLRARLVREMRTCRNLTQADLCRLLNSHPQIPLLYSKYQGFRRHYPFNTDFVESLEANKIFLEYNEFGGGFLFDLRLGFPTHEIVLLVARICNLEAQFFTFTKWCREYSEIYHQRYSERSAARFQECIENRRLKLVDEEFSAAYFLKSIDRSNSNLPKFE
jgi:hypothetical protein